MALKRWYSVRWRLFVPILAMMFFIIAIIILLQYKREVDYRTAQIRSELEKINFRIQRGYNAHEDLNKLLQVLDVYFDDSVIEGVRVSIYQDGGDLIAAIGEPLEAERKIDLKKSFPDDPKAGWSKGNSSVEDGEDLFFFTKNKSADGQIAVYTALPFTVTIGDALTMGPIYWLTILAVVIIAIIITYIYTGYISKTVVTLSEFSHQAASGNLDIETIKEKFPNSEMGDIARRIVSIYADKVKAIKRIEKEHQIAINAVEEKAAVKRRLTNNLNHELKTPVSVLKGYIETMIANNDMDEATRLHFLTRANEKADQLCNLLKDVSTMTRLEEASDTVPMEEIDFHDLVFQLDNDLEMAGVLGNMEFTYDIPFDCHVKGNATLLTGALTNLIKNAVLHSGGTSMKLQLVSTSSKYYSFMFVDNGKGVPQNHLQHLFERFYRVDSGRSRKVGGTGLGLPIVKNIIETHGGSISVQNVVTGGLKIVFSLERYIEPNKKQS